MFVSRKAYQELEANLEAWRVYAESLERKNKQLKADLYTLQDLVYSNTQPVRVVGVGSTYSLPGFATPDSVQFNGKGELVATPKITLGYIRYKSVKRITAKSEEKSKTGKGKTDKPAKNADSNGKAVQSSNGNGNKPAVKSDSSKNGKHKDSTPKNDALIITELEKTIARKLGVSEHKTALERINKWRVKGKDCSLYAGWLVNEFKNK